MSEEGWGNIAFNWVNKGGVCGFYGCNSGNSANGPAFNQRISGLANFKNVDVLGQVTYSYPSKEAKSRKTDAGIRKGEHSVSTYFVASDRGSIKGRYYKGNAYPMSVYRNGKWQLSRYQPR